jgi:uncharacterized protein YecE (DUF72 family)
MQILVGTSGWSYIHWLGPFYPSDLPRSKWLLHYAQSFSLVEVNATFYHGFKDQTYVSWREGTPPDFHFILKVPRWITHRKVLDDVATEIQDFDRAGSLLGDKLDLYLMQLSPSTPYDLKRLRKALVAFDKPSRVAIEVRSENWLTEAFFGLLRELDVTYCNPDSPRFKLTSIVTSSSLYLRLHGRQRWYDSDYSLEELKEIAQMILQAGDQGVLNVFVLFNNDFQAYAPANARTLLELLGSGNKKKTGQ